MVATFAARRSTAADAPLAQADAEQLFLAKVWPTMKAKCLACHGDDEKKIKGELDLRTRDAALKGGESGKPSIVAGSPEKSPFYVAVTRHDPDLLMPPKDNDKLSAEQVEHVRLWIAAGAPWPDPEKVQPVASRWNEADGIAVATSGGLSADWTNRKYKPEDLWAYKPIARPAVPAVKSASPAGLNGIDAFILQKLQSKGIAGLAGPADRLTLIRRATFDLTGLPPAAAEVEAFVNDTAPDAFARLVERLLASPQYGEQQARHWLDVVRYADSAGFSNDFERPNAWRYRDYVVRSMNADKPFDRFVLEQIAGDELDPQDPEMQIAVGYLRMGPWEHTGMTVAAVTRQQFLDDVTHSVGVTFLGQGLRCASCHDHKFDPVPTKDYYRIQAVFGSTQFAERDVPFLPVENVSGFEAQRKVVEQRLAQLNVGKAELKRRADEGLAAFLKEKGVAKVEDLPQDQRPKKDYLGSTAGISNLDLSLRKIYQKSDAYLERELLRFDPLAFSVYSGPANNYTSVKARNPIPGKQQMAKAAVQKVHILTGGSVESPAAEVTPGVLSVVDGSNDTVQPSEWNTIPTTAEGRRLRFARWVASPKNTLTARVIVNRIWQQHFGHGLVPTPNNFGKMGGKPTHPELLDHLATWFMDNGWSIKKLHRYIMASATYQQSPTPPRVAGVDVQAIDPKNQLLAYFPPRRLSAEEIRDSILAVSGELNPEAGGPGVFPEINWEVAMQPRHIMGSVAPAYIPSATPKERNRRTIYAFRYRTLPDPMLEVFNRPGSEMSCEKRDETTVTPQVFALFNSQFTASRSLAMAANVSKTGDAIEAQMDVAFRRVFGRAPTADERAACLSHYQKMLDHHRKTAPVAAKLPSHVERHMVEELTGEPVVWQEDLGVLKSYQQDLQPTQVSAEVRALAEVCLVLLNSNEFLYVR
ncbi:PSD1 and planctomycete cytochrome C domain-containing protein [Humisphaera borealis]|uniref:PSD1 domain-containing protein n=1 Tax=Humisphaera borealis TaxID=2807512 RepID=A0A7M2WUE4_9BACT|nr:PSD1 and planctomycete cytochrome C domain-containing protein [Humisphaera borealis]QOV88894.1 PSD1 domain-containing protein [Humisphaera borealis]